MTTIWHRLVNELNAGTVDLAQHNILVNEDQGLYCLKYSHIATKSHWVTRACRGTVLDKDSQGNWRLVAAGFERFYNLGEVPELQSQFNWSSFRVEEKWDGSLIVLFYYQPEGRWVTATSGSPRGKGFVGKSNWEGSFSDLYWECFNRNNFRVENLDKSQIYIQELITPHNRVVVDYHEQWLLRTLAVRDATNFSEISDKENSCTKELLPNLLSTLDNTSGLESEGFILVDNSGNRIKLKAPNYVQLHRANSNGQPDLGQLWRSGELDEFLIYFPQFSSQAQAMLAKINRDLSEIETLVSNFNGDFPYFAKEYSSHRLFGCAINSLRKGLSPRESLANISKKRFKRDYS